MAFVENLVGLAPPVLPVMQTIYGAQQSTITPTIDTKNVQTKTPPR
jgi:hypothetical protein